MKRLLVPACVMALCMALAACRGDIGQAAAVPAVKPASTSADSGAVSTPRPQRDLLPTPQEVLAGTHWPAATVGQGKAAISCSSDYAAGDGVPLHDLQYFSVLDAMDGCRNAGLVRLHYAGKIDAGFAALVERAGAMAARMAIPHRILDLDSPGGQVEDAIRAGDAIGASQWTLWVREGAVCHSACVLILAAGDNRLVSGQVGVHRMIRMSSTASTRAQLKDELRAVQQQMQDYLERNGAAGSIADLMMTVPSRDLRLLAGDELARFGLVGANAAQEDLERIRLLRKCGEAFVRRKEDFNRRFERECAVGHAQVEAMNSCARDLRSRFGFPDGQCADESPMAESDVASR